MNHPLEKVKVAIVYDHLTTAYGGAELVLQVLLSLFPDAPLFTTVFDSSKISWVPKKRVKTSFLQQFGWFKNQHQLLAPLHPLAIEQLDLSEFGLVISVTAGVAKGVLTLPHQLHVCYMLTPPRYLSDDDDEQQSYLESHSVLSVPVLKFLTQPIFNYLRSWDQVAAWRPDKVIAISQLVADRIEKKYGRHADKIIYPPYIPFSDTSNNQETKQLPEFLLSFSRLVSYKRVDLAIHSCLQLNKMLVVAGEGISRHSLQAIAPKQTYIRKKSQSVATTLQEATKHNKLLVFVGHCSKSEKEMLLRQCKGLIMPGVEDFGLTALEAADAGKPSIVNQESGVAEILTEPKYAVHLKNKTVSNLSEAIIRFEESSIAPSELSAVASKYNEERFSEAFMNTLYQFWRQHSTISPVKLQK